MRSHLHTAHPLQGSSAAAPTSASLTRPVAATVLLLVVAGLGVRLWLCWQPLAPMLGGYVADDAFYYLNIARNLAAGHGPTFDGITATNGFHPLYMGLLWLLTSAGITEPVLLLRIALSLLALASAATGLLLFAIARRALGVTAAVFALLMWELGPQPIRISLTGVEVALSALLCAATALAWMRARESGWPSPRASALVGMLAGLAMLARTDAMFLAAAIGLEQLWSLRHSRGSRGPFRARLRSLAVFCATGAAVVSPWIAWNLLTFGRLTQDSARALLHRSHSYYGWRLEHGVELGLPRYLGGKLVRWAGDLIEYVGFGRLGLGVVALVTVGCLALAIVRRSRGRASPWRAYAGQFGFLWVYALLTALFYCLYFWYRQQWYLLGSLAVVLLTLSAAAADLHAWSCQRLSRPIQRAITLSAFGLSLALLLHSNLRMLQQETYPWQRVHLRAATLIRHGLDPHQRIGAFNAGILGYFSGRPVVNLDGVVNPEALEAMRNKRLYGYLEQRDIRYLVDAPGAISQHSVWGGPRYSTGFAPISRITAQGSDHTLLIVRRASP